MMRIYQDFAVRILERDVVYITGDSGSGKSLLLKELRLQAAEAISMKTAQRRFAMPTYSSESIGR